MSTGALIVKEVQKHVQNSSIGLGVVLLFLGIVGIFYGLRLRRQSKGLTDQEQQLLKELLLKKKGEQP